MLIVCLDWCLQQGPRYLFKFSVRPLMETFIKLYVEKMADAPAKNKAPAKPKKPGAHPKYSEMIAKAIAALKERGSSYRQAILKYIMANFSVGKDAKTVNVHLKLVLRAGVKNKSLKQSKGTGASGSFKIGEVHKSARKKAGKKAVKTKAAKPKKAKTPKKAKEPTGEKKAADPKAKKPAAKKTADKPAAKKPATKKAIKWPKKTKTSAKLKKAQTPKKK